MFKSEHWLYRTIECDTDGDPLDHGVVTAANLKLAEYALRQRFTRIAGEGSWEVYLYELEPSVGVWEDRGIRITTTITFTEADE